MREAVYDLEILHSRQHPVKQVFKVAGYSLFVDVARFDSKDATTLLGFDRTRLHTFRRRDFLLLRDARKSADKTAKMFLFEQTGLRAEKVFLLAHPAICGYVFNPVSFFFFYSENSHIATVVEVNNTFGEQKHFVLLAGSNWAERQKDFYVSPFLSQFSNFRMQVEPPANSLHISIHTHGKSQIELTAQMTGLRYSLSDLRLFWSFLKFPFHTMRVIMLIHWFALKLFFRRVPFYAKDNADAALLHKKLRSQL
jgi:uncharacterized protein